MSKARSRLSFILLLAAVAMSVPLVLGFLGAVHPALDSFAHFRIHLAVVMALLALPLVFTDMRREGAMLLLLAIMALGTTLGISGDFKSKPEDSTQSGPRYSIIQINLREDNPDPKRILQMIAREKPDIIAYEEASDEWSKWLDILEASYPYRLDCREDPRIKGVGILSRRPFSEDGKSICIGNGILAIAPINLGGSNVNVAALRLSRPWPHWQAFQLGFIEQELRRLDAPTIIAGDFNASPWSHAVRRVEDASKTAHIKGSGGTWLPSFLPVSWAPYIGLPIDQFLASPDIIAPKVSTRQDASSDHLPVRLDFSVPPPVHLDEAEAETQSVTLY